ncbi:MAG: T9SS type A sorting domain-containing protein [Bacteroidaceae bacterium]|nr:T9SS type A sorting domain-containing protein [Bacteroidaceae bacterium]
MKRLIFIISFIAFAGIASAQHIVVEKKDSNNEAFLFENLKQITFNGTTVNFEMTDGVTSCASMDSIERIYFDDLSSIADINAFSNDLIEYISPDEIAINSEAGSTATIFNLAGVQMMSRRISTRGEAISIAGLSKGIYIVKANEKTIKIIKR